jgi:hypothetical protein
MMDGQKTLNYTNPCKNSTLERANGARCVFSIQRNFAFRFVEFFSRLPYVIDSQGIGCIGHIWHRILPAAIFKAKFFSKLCSF